MSRIFFIDVPFLFQEIESSISISYLCSFSEGAHSKYLIFFFFKHTLLFLSFHSRLKGNLLTGKKYNTKIRKSQMIPCWCCFYVLSIKAALLSLCWSIQGEVGCCYDGKPCRQLWVKRESAGVTITFGISFLLKRKKRITQSRFTPIFNRCGIF